MYITQTKAEFCLIILNVVTLTTARAAVSSMSGSSNSTHENPISSNKRRDFLDMWYLNHPTIAKFSSIGLIMMDGSIASGIGVGLTEISSKSVRSPAVEALGDEVR